MFFLSPSCDLHTLETVASDQNNNQLDISFLNGLTVTTERHIEHISLNLHSLV